MDFEIFTKYNWWFFLFQDEIENMVRQGEEHAAADLLIKERIEAVNQGKLFFKDVLIILDIVVSLSDLSFMMKPLRPFWAKKKSIKFIYSEKATKYVY